MNVREQVRINPPGLRATNHSNLIPREFSEHGTVSFDLNLEPVLGEQLDQRAKVLPHRLAARDDHKIIAVVLDGAQDLSGRHEMPSGRVVGVATGALQVTPSQANEDRTATSKRAFALNRAEDRMDVEVARWVAIRFFCWLTVKHMTSCKYAFIIGSGNLPA